MKKFFGFGSSTPPPPPPPLKPPSPPAKSPPKTPSTSVAPPIVGRWKEPSGGDTTEFHVDGTVTEKLASGETIRGRYLLVGTKLTINLEGVPDPLAFTASVKDDALEMTDPEKQTTTYRRL